MAPMKQSSNNYSSSGGEDVVRQANVLASCYVVDSNAASLKGLHYCTTGATGLPSPPSSPPLAAITSTNQLALTPKAKSSRHGRPSGNNNNNNNNNFARRRGGAALRIREECVRFFCETLRALFLVERNEAPRGSGLTGVYHNNNNNNDNDNYDYDYNDSNNDLRFRSATLGANGQLTPPPDNPYFAGADPLSSDVMLGAHTACAWLEIWDYAGGASFRAFLTEDTGPASCGEKALFVFFDAGALGRDLKQALVALIELAEGPLGSAHMVICVDRAIPADEVRALTKGLQWAGFGLTTLDFWTGGVDATSAQWVFMGMEL